MSNFEYAESLVYVVRSNIAGFLKLLELDTVQLVRDRYGNIVPGAKLDDNDRLDFPGDSRHGNELPDGWETFNCYPLQPKFLVKTAKSLITTMGKFREYIDMNPHSDVSISTIVTAEELEKICAKVKLDERFAKNPRVFLALQEAAITCGYTDLVEPFHLETIWAAALQCKFESENPPNRSNRPERKSVDELMAELDTIDPDLFSENFEQYADLHADACALLISLSPSDSAAQHPFREIGSR